MSLRELLEFHAAAAAAAVVDGVGAAAGVGAGIGVGAVAPVCLCRCAILLDELDDYRGLRKGRALGHIVVETRTANAIPLLRYSCSKRAIALPTGQLNARRVSLAAI